MFASTGETVGKSSNNFLKAFGNTPTSARPADAPQVDRLSRPGSGLGLITDKSSFEMDARSNAGSPYQSRFPAASVAGLQGWSSDVNYYPLSPPDSGSYTPKDWAFNFQEPNTSNVLANIQRPATREQFGQVTPTEEQDDDENIFNYQFREQMQNDTQQDEDIPSSQKRKRNNALNANDGNQPTKRTRKYASRGSLNPNAIDLTKPEDVRRSKFLERNRVAASKCRQKKKEWTQNLEDRARELQKNNASLRMMIESLRQEVLFLKGEMLRHDSCDCTQIQEFLASGAKIVQDMSEEDLVLKRETSPVESMPPSRSRSPDDDCESRRSVSPAPQMSSVVDEDSALEALLTSSMKHDTSDEGIAMQVRC